MVTCLPQLARALSQESAKAEAIYVEHLHVSEMIDLSVGVTSISIHCAQFSLSISLADIGPPKEYEKNIKMPQTQGPQDVGGLDVLQTPSDHSEFNTSQHPFSKPFACQHPNDSKDM